MKDLTCRKVWVRRNWTRLERDMKENREERKMKVKKTCRRKETRQGRGR